MTQGMNPFPSTALRVARLAEDVGGFDAHGFADHYGAAFFVVYGVAPAGRTAGFRTNVVHGDTAPTSPENAIVDVDMNALLQRRASGGDGLEAFAVPIARRAGSLNEFISIGRLDGNDICFADATVSKFHALVRHIDGAFFILDGNSRNGTRVNGAPAGKRGERATRLASGDVVQFANVTCTFMDAAAVLALAQRDG
jgi:hypothetical protein